MALFFGTLTLKPVIEIDGIPANSFWTDLLRNSSHSREPPMWLNVSDIESFANQEDDEERFFQRLADSLKRNCERAKYAEVMARRRTHM